MRPLKALISLDEAMRTFHAPSNVLALACATGIAKANTVTNSPLRKQFMTRPCG